MSDTNKGGSAGEVGLRIKSLRRSAGLSQANLGNALGVTFQQVQKYESGRSKIAAEKLHQIAQALGVDISYFYETKQGAGPSDKTGETALTQVTSEGALFKDSFDRIKDPRARYLLAELARVFCEIEAGR
ncbi:helix-turn-helix domain-containing protein [Methylobacterium sp. J-068]|uniref:helix-turn-helix domain-containing protein n=1 Tax=Methylobacterium sp. J-068 TaxID=2836649 RepID=UPI001FB94445|nr:helix-turn-helix transcriptional regulator [Methylobacterium sp. J-068]MCJ2035787.1 helix-turn-helix domain-containing protein [Methylobacterium sp. J-068]